MNLSEPYNETTFTRFIQDFFPDFVLDKRNVPAQKDIFPSHTPEEAFLPGKTRWLVVAIKTFLLIIIID